MSDIVEGYRKILRADVRKIYDDNGKFLHIKDLDDDLAFAVTSIEYKNVGNKRVIMKPSRLRLSDKKAVLDSLAKIKGLFIERRQLELNTDALDAIFKSLPGDVAAELRVRVMSRISRGNSK